MHSRQDCLVLTTKVYPLKTTNRIGFETNQKTATIFQYQNFFFSQNKLLSFTSSTNSDCSKWRWSETGDIQWESAHKNHKPNIHQIHIDKRRNPSIKCPFFFHVFSTCFFPPQLFLLQRSDFYYFSPSCHPSWSFPCVLFFPLGTVFTRMLHEIRSYKCCKYRQRNWCPKIQPLESRVMQKN